MIILNENRPVGYGEKYYALEDGTVKRLTVLGSMFRYETIEAGEDYTDDDCMVVIVKL